MWSANCPSGVRLPQYPHSGFQIWSHIAVEISLSWFEWNCLITVFLSWSADIASHLFEFGVMCCMLSTCHVSSRKLWSTSVSHSFSFLNSSLGLLEVNITRKLLSLSLELFFKILLFQVTFLTFFFIACILCFIYVRKIVIPMYRLWLHGLYRLHGLRCLLFRKGC